jgi:hypothetical protein
MVLSNNSLFALSSVSISGKSFDDSITGNTTEVQTRLVSCIQILIKQSTKSCVCLSKKTRDYHACHLRKKYS